MDRLNVAVAEMRNGRNGQYVYVKDVAGIEYGCFDPALYSQLVPGARLQATIALSNNGRFRNITALAPGAAGQAPLASSAWGGTASAPASKDAQIARAVALKAAVDSMGAFPFDVDPLSYAGKVIALASFYLDWLEGDDRAPF
jgi:hypothetical protein